MAGFSYTYTLTNGTAADADQVMGNFNDVKNSLQDGSKDASIGALTVAGAALFNGNVTLGNASNDAITVTGPLTVTDVALFNGNVTLGNATGDDVTVTGSLASSIPIKTTYSYDLGADAKGLKSAFFGSADSAARSTQLIGATISASAVVTLPNKTGTLPIVETSYVIADSGNGHGSTNTRIRRFTNNASSGSAITYADSATNGATFTIAEAGLYFINYCDSKSGGATEIGISLNSNQLTTDPSGITKTNLLSFAVPAATQYITVSALRRLAVNDVLRAHTGGSANSTASISFFEVRKIST